MAKYLVVRIQCVAKKVVRQDQTSFVLGQFILDTMFSTWEDMDWTKESGQHAIFLKIDFDKSYD